jgi:hypothetical protein
MVLAGIEGVDNAPTGAQEKASSVADSTSQLISKLESDVGQAPTIDMLKLEVTAQMADSDGLDVDLDLLAKDKSTCTTAELEMIRRERNRMHAKKTRMRKKKMIQEMEAVSTPRSHAHTINPHVMCSI